MNILAPLLLCLCLTFGGRAFAGDPNEPHPHQGIAEKFTNPTPTELTPEELETLEAGESVRRQIRHDDGGRGISIMDVQGTSEAVWAVIMDFDSYPNWVDMMEETEVYFDNDRDRIKVFFVLRVMGMEVEYWIDHRYDLEAGHLIWELDYSKHSDIDDSTGYWLVYPAPDRPGYTRVEYTTDLRLSGFVPSVVENMLANQGLDRATRWVKQQVEE